MRRYFSLPWREGPVYSHSSYKEHPGIQDLVAQALVIHQPFSITILKATITLEMWLLGPDQTAAL